MSKLSDNDHQDDQNGLRKDIHIDRDALNLPYQEEMRRIEHDSAVERVNHRVTLLAILIPCLLGALVLYAYLDIEKHIERMQDVGSVQVKALSDDVLDKVSSVSEQYGKLAASLSNRITALEASVVLTKEDLEKQRKEMDRIDRSKADNESLKRIEQQTAEAAGLLHGLREALDAQSLALENLNTAFKAEAASFVQAVDTIRGEMKNDRKTQASAIEKLSEVKLDKRTFDQFLKRERESYESVTRPLQREIESLHQELSGLKKQMNMLGRSIQLLEAERAVLNAGPEQAREAAPSTGSGKIIEQEIRE